MPDQPQRSPLAVYPSDYKPGASKAPKRTLAAIIGTSAAALLLTMIPKEESGRTVDVTVASDGTATVRHVSGKQYLSAYLDIVSVPTACDGLTAGVKIGQRYTEAQCAAKLEAELIDQAEHVMACTPGIRPAGREMQRVAAVSLAYNIGWPRYCKSTAARRFNAGDIRGACDAFLLWNRAGGRVVAGLDARRKRERAICLKGL